MVRRAAAVWRSALLLQRKAYVSLTGQAVLGSHQNEPFSTETEVVKLYAVYNVQRAKKPRQNVYNILYT